MLTVLHTPKTADNDLLAEQAAMQRAALRLFEHWNITDAEAAILLGGISPRSLHRWRKGEYGRHSRDLSDRLSHILGIHKGLRLVFADPQRGYAWVRKPNADLGGASALDVMLAGGMADLQRIRSYLDSMRGGW
ncbi:MbcA/ParS/Xre antitoxin family protein [Roseinatronobacter monicus]|uniref:Uncharacterized protein DUF2384 n=1 Tax=Roseinatronobacter monicus TaxID=393481 RepID=A0A543K3T6_9RHOB|nr:MbcA/ParS/Xre antitoxin family protein [Roseinatronobacter monicus]TQM89726.1 uncharacterized protein DUF2384 [Roseinatronobacter monicus]